MGRTACTEPHCLYSRAVPVLPLWAVRPVQSLSACTVQLYLYTPYWPYGLYSASLPVQGCTLLFTQCYTNDKIIIPFVYVFFCVYWSCFYMDNCDIAASNNNQLSHKGNSVLCQNFMLCVLLTLCPLHTVTIKPVQQTGVLCLQNLLLLFLRWWVEWYRHHKNYVKYFEVSHFVHSHIQNTSLITQKKCTIFIHYLIHWAEFFLRN